MRWKLKDLLAEAAHPVPEKAVLTDFRHAKTTGAGVGGKQQNKKRKKGYDKVNGEPLVKHENCKTDNEYCHSAMIHKGGRHTRPCFCYY